MKSRSAIKIDLFADQYRRTKIESLGDPLTEIKLHLDFAAPATDVDQIAPQPISPQSDLPVYRTLQRR